MRSLTWWASVSRRRQTGWCEAVVEGRVRYSLPFHSVPLAELQRILIKLSCTNSFFFHFSYLTFHGVTPDLADLYPPVIWHVDALKCRSGKGFKLHYFMGERWRASISPGYGTSTWACPPPSASPPPPPHRPLWRPSLVPCPRLPSRTRSRGRPIFPYHPEIAIYSILKKSIGSAARPSQRPYCFKYVDGV